MRLLAELIVIGALVFVAWDKSIRDRLSEVPVIGQAFATPNSPAHHGRGVRSAAARPGPTISNGAWMWDPKRHTALDAPSPTPQPTAQ